MAGTSRPGPRRRQGPGRYAHSHGQNRHMAMKVEITTVLLCIALVAAGLASHLVWRLSQLEEAGQRVNARAYIAAHKWTTLNMICAAYGLLTLAYFTGELGPVGAF